MKVIFEGSEAEIAKIVKENSIRERRGLVKVLFLEENGSDSKEVTVEDTKEVVIDDSKEVTVEKPTSHRGKKSK